MANNQGKIINMPQKKYTILLVEDDPMQVEMYKEQFTSVGYDILIAKNLVEMEEEIGKIKPDLILLDMLLGNDSGYDYLVQLKKNKETKDIKVVVFTNFTAKGVAEKCKKAGALDFLVKDSYLPHEIAEKIKDYL